MEKPTSPRKRARLETDGPEVIDLLDEEDEVSEQSRRVPNANHRVAQQRMEGISGAALGQPKDNSNSSDRYSLDQKHYSDSKRVEKSENGLITNYGNRSNAPELPVIRVTVPLAGKVVQKLITQGTNTDTQRDGMQTVINIIKFLSMDSKANASTPGDHGNGRPLVLTTKNTSRLVDEFVSAHRKSVMESVELAFSETKERHKKIVEHIQYHYNDYLNEMKKKLEKVKRNKKDFLNAESERLKLGEKYKDELKQREKFHDELMKRFMEACSGKIASVEANIANEEEKGRMEFAANIQNNLSLIKNSSSIE